MTHTPMDLFPLSIQERFDKFDKDNPKIFGLYKRFAFKFLETGKKKCGIGLITERIRWEVTVETTGKDFKISNDFRSRYARKLMREVPGLEGLFNTKKLTA